MHFSRSRALWFALFVGVMTYATLAPARAQSSNDEAWAWCTKAQSRSSLETVIKGCNAAIASKALNDRDLAIALSNRGNAYRIGGDPDRAVADITEALRLNPRFANAFYNRGQAYLDKKTTTAPSRTSAK